VGRRHLTHLRNRARLRRANTPKSSPSRPPSLNTSQKSSPPAAGKYSEFEPACGGLPSLNTSQKSSPPAAGKSSEFEPACGGPHVTPLTKQALKTAFCLKTAIFETFQSISRQPGRVRASHLVRLVQKDQAVILKSLNPIFIPSDSALENPKPSANPQHLDLFPVLSGTLPLALVGCNLFFVFEGNYACIAMRIGWQKR
jgi:hypothetical protein